MGAQLRVVKKAPDCGVTRDIADIVQSSLKQ